MIDENKIVEKSSELYIKYGIKSVSVDDVAFVLGISKKTLYEHIENKNALIQKVVETNLCNFFDDMLSKIEQEEDVFKCLCTIALYTLKMVNRTNPSYVHDLKKYHNSEYRKIIEFRDNKLFKTFENCLEKGIREGLIIGDTDIRCAFFNQMLKVSILNSESDFDYVGSPSVQKMYKMILNDIRGITTIKGHKIFEQNYEILLHLK
ncbi:TetR/AcrR family transcriptional regulator [Maribellus maritimus]|uniref:TetR/AcrR family transcriptional regulator n=1 Tax=Maribellus maritimus TaxID=2870838 RepID=UPI001EEB6161|nr:TetR/AcrR family transcriptional regulator [Maribellus maritimus]MCG6189472.1 TetR/AcrR family transcriptional regulator [Maribellus maritimus]